MNVADWTGHNESDGTGLRYQGIPVGVAGDSDLQQQSADSQKPSPSPAQPQPAESGLDLASLDLSDLNFDATLEHEHSEHQNNLAHSR